MKPIYNSSSKTIVKLLCNVSFLFLVTLLLSSLFTSCTTDEIEVKPKTTTKDMYLQSRDTILNVSNTTNSGDIDPPPPVKGNNPPPPPPNP